MTPAQQKQSIYLQASTCIQVATECHWKDKLLSSSSTSFIEHRKLVSRPSSPSRVEPTGRDL